MFQDYMFFGVDKKVFYSFRLLHMTQIANYAKEMHALEKNRALLLSEVLAGCLLLSSILDYEERINLRVQCGTHFTIGAEATYLGEVRGYIECNDDSEIVQKIDSGIKIENEYMIRTLRTQSNNSLLSQGNTKFTSDNICDALNDHLKNSYQMNTGVKIASWYDHDLEKIRTYGLIYQELPEIPEELSLKLIQSMSKIKDLKEIILKDEDPDVIVKNLIEDEIRGVKSINPKFVCECSTEKVEQVLSTLPRDELLDIMKKGNDVNIKCHYCSKNHVVNTNRVNEIFASVVSPASGKH